MADSIKIGNLDISAFKVGSSDCKVYLGDTLLYPTTPPTPTGSTCYEVISTPITSYTATTYDSVYSFTDFKWYMKNNLSQYEQYGVYDIVEDISSATTYDGKLGVVGTTEYQYSGNSWSVVGTYEDSATTYTITDEDQYEYQGVELPTTFKIPKADIESISSVDISIYTQDSEELSIKHGGYNYRNWDEDIDEEGTVTEDEDYFYFSMTSVQSVIIESINYSEPEPIHIIAGTRQVSVEYPTKDVPLANVYNTVADMEADVCPNVGINQYGVVGNDAYQFDGEDWNSASNYKLMEKNADGKANVLLCNSSTVLVKAETQPSYFNNITDVVIGDCVTSIGDSTFEDCNGLTSIDIPDSVTSIGDSAFQDCTSLTSITIPSSVTSIGQYTLRYCIGLTSIIIPSGVTSIGLGAFWQCHGITSIDIPSGVTILNNHIFYNCTSLTSVTIPSTVTSIGGSVFESCTRLTSIDIPSSITSIGLAAFQGCTRLTSIDIPSGVTSIGIQAFNNCTSLSSITVEATTPPTLGRNAFKNTNNCTIYVPSASVNAYKSATNWSTYASRITAILNS